LTQPASSPETADTVARHQPQFEAQPQALAPPVQEHDSEPPIASPFHASAAVVPAVPIVASPVTAEAAPVTARPEPQLAPPAPRAAAASRPIPELPPVSLTLPPESGLELVETKFKPAPTTDEEPATPSGPRRVRPPKVAVVEEPLQIVETQRSNPPAG